MNKVKLNKKIMEVCDAYEVIRQSVAKIETPQGSGTGFLVSNGKNKKICGIATASQVIHHAHLWQEPILITHETSQKSNFLHHSQRAVLSDPNADIGSITFVRGGIEFPENPIEITPLNRYLRIGSEVFWVGYPAVAPQSTLCLFSGKISFWRQAEKVYLIDGVAINGVSGGPVFTVIEGNIIIIGIISAYIPNRTTGEALPGLSIARDVTSLHNEINKFKSFDEAKEKEAEKDTKTEK